MDIELRIKEFVFDNFMFGGNMDDLTGDLSFMNSGIINSLGVLELISFAEEAFEIQVADDEVVPDNFDSVNKMTTYIRSKLALAVTV